MQQHYWFWILGGMLLLWGGSLFLVGRLTKQRLLKTWAAEGIRAGELDIHLDDPRPPDQAAVELIRSYRRRFLLQLWPETQFGFGAVNNVAQDLLKEIARLYYPEEERPELKASLADLVALYTRVGNRLNIWLDTLPLRPLKDIELNTVLMVHEAYQKVRQHPAYLFLKRHHLDKAARLMWTAKNLVNPWYWGRKAAYTGSRELLGRLFMAKVATVVGEEAIRLYGRRPPHLRLLVCYRLTLQELINLTMSNGELPPQVANTLLRFILRGRGLEDQDKMALLKLLAHPRSQEATTWEGLNQAERRQVQRWLKQLTISCDCAPYPEEQ